MIDVRDVLFRKGDQPSPTLGRQLKGFTSVDIGPPVYGIVTREYEGVGKFGKHVREQARHYLMNLFGSLYFAIAI